MQEEEEAAPAGMCLDAAQQDAHRHFVAVRAVHRIGAVVGPAGDAACVCVGKRAKKMPTREREAAHVIYMRKMA